MTVCEPRPALKPLHTGKGKEGQDTILPRDVPEQLCFSRCILRFGTEFQVAMYQEIISSTGRFSHKHLCQLSTMTKALAAEIPYAIDCDCKSVPSLLYTVLYDIIQRLFAKVKATNSGSFQLNKG